MSGVFRNCAFVIAIFAAIISDNSEVSANQNQHTTPSSPKNKSIDKCNMDYLNSLPPDQKDMSPKHLGDPLPADKFEKLCKLKRPNHLRHMCAGTGDEADLYGTCNAICYNLGFGWKGCTCAVPDNDKPDVGYWLCGCSQNPTDSAQPGWYFVSWEKLKPSKFFETEQECKSNGLRVFYSIDKKN